MAQTVYTFSLGQMPADANGGCPQALILMDNATHREIARVPYDAAAMLIIAALGLARP